MAVIKEYRGFQLPSELTRLRQWKHALKERESVKAIANSKEFYLQRYARFASVPAGAVK
ncbi:hypothetical protein [Scytonema sp. HK-05]|uniref:hypothetical protein n=1 Tax=Scytonema sp. HK-05 TaxID=1137095 RepID=UPI000ADCAC7E|nr:hypothetical protein [Scytonema sp. HK-05]